MNNRKAEFYALRTSLGYSREAFAKSFGVQARSVRRWEDPQKENEPPEEAFEKLREINEALSTLHETSFLLFCAIAENSLEEGENVFPIPVYFNQEAYYNSVHRPAGECLYYGAVNHVATSLAFAIAEKYPDIEVTFDYVETVNEN